MNEVLKILDEIGLPFVYGHWAEGEVPNLPYICYSTEYTTPFGADGMVYADFVSVSIELYTNIKDAQNLNKIRSVLARHCIYYSRTETWIPDENLYKVLFQFEIMEVN